MAKKKDKKAAAVQAGEHPSATADEDQTAREAAGTGDGAASKEKPLGSAKAVDTLFRNAIRAELDILALAATKANIMISLNGLIISVLMISGVFIFASTPIFLFPAAIFMLTAAASIIFALLAASPERPELLCNLRDWIVDMFRRQARLRDLPGYLRRKNPDKDEINLLIYRDRALLSREDYWQRMQFLLRDRNEIYYQMSDQLYWLGLQADRSFRQLNVSYTVFRWGLVASVLAFVGTKSVFGMFPGLSGTQTAQLRNLGISAFEDIYEPSAVQQLPDGRVLVVEDEASRAISVMSIAADGSLVEDKAADARLTRSFGRKLSDLEGLSIDDSGNIYAITSHSSNKDGERRPDREQLLRFRVSGNKVGNIVSYTSLRDTLASSPELKAAIEEKAGEEIDFNELNIEGLAFYREAQDLLIGLREPMAGDKSVILVITNPVELLENQAAPEFGEPTLLDLQGGGIRALSYDPVMQAFLIVNEIEGYDNNRYSQLWSWGGNPDVPPEPVALPDIINLNNVESIDSITIDGEARLLLMSDEGSKKKDRPAQYMMLEYGQLAQ